MVVIVAVSVLAGAATWSVLDARERARFDNEVERLDVALAERMRAYVQVLRGGVGLFAASRDVTREDWNVYVESLQIEDRYPGFKSLSYAPAVATADLDALVRSVRSERLPEGLGPADTLRGFTLRAPEGSDHLTEVHAPVLYVAPFDGANIQALGVDMMLEPMRRSVMSRAEASGEATISRRLKLSGSVGDKAGFIVYMPIVSQGDFTGWLTAAFFAEAFTAGLEQPGGTSLEFEIFDGPETTASTRLYSTAGRLPDGSPRAMPDSRGAFTATSLVEVPGSHWRVRYAAPDSFVSPWSRVTPWLVLLLGALTGAAFFVISRGEERWRTQAILLEEQAGILTRAREEAESATRAKSAFLATMSHEIRTPLNAVLGINRALRETALEADQKRYVQVIDESGTHLLRVINEILDFSKIEADRVVLERERFDLAACVQSVVSLMRPGADEAAVTLIAEVDVGQWAWGDVSRLRQVLLNLVANALKFTPAGGVVRLTARREKGDEVSFAVADTGIGMTPEQVGRVFDPFVQAETSTARLHGGTGLGLAIAGRIVAAMGGRLQVASTPGAGSTFFFSLTAEPADPPAPAEVDPGHDGPGLAERHPLKVLVAEDDDVNQLVVERMLTSLGYTADVVGDGAEAVQAVRSGQYDVVLLDLQMPVMDGRAAAVAIQELRGQGRRPRLVAMTGSASDADRRRAAEADFEDFVVKPYDPSDLAAALRRTPSRDPGR